MKFYFCETCGKRVTEANVEAGDAKDKKLKGVYCAQCAVGVMTMETLPLTDEQARKLLKKEATPTPAPFPASLRKSDTGKHLAIRKPTPAPAAKAKVSATTMAGGIAGVLVISILLLFSIWPNTQGAGDKRPNSEGKTFKSTETRVSTGEPLPLKKQVPVEATYAAVKTEQSNDKSEPVAPDLKALNLTPVVSNAPPEPPVVQKTESAPDSAAKPPPENQVATPEPARGYDAGPLLEKFAQALGTQDATEARRLLQGAPETPETVRTQLEQILQWEANELQKCRETLTALKGKPIDLLTKTGPVKGDIARVDDKGVWIGKSFQINGEWKKGPTQCVAWSTIAPSAARQLVPLPEPLPAADAFAAGLIAFAHGDFRNSEAYLAKAQGSSLAAALSEVLARRQAQARLSEATDAWEILRKRVETCASNVQAQQLTKDIEGFSTQFKDTQFILRPEWEQERMQLNAQINKLAMALDPRIAKLFHGEVKAYDPRKQLIEIHYDLSNPEHRKDFQYEIYDRGQPDPISGVTESKEGLSLHSSRVFNEVLGIPQFAADNVTVVVHYQNFKPSPDGALAGCMFGLEKSEGTATRLATVVCKQKASCAAQVVTYDNWYSQPSLSSKEMSEDPPLKGILEFGCSAQRYWVKLDGKVLLEYQSPNANDRRGLILLVGRTFSYLATRIEVKGTLDSRWLRSQLK